MVPRNLVRLAVRTDQDRLQLDMLATTGGVTLATTIGELLPAELAPHVKGSV